MRLRCKKCGSETPEELVFCLNCRTRLVPRNVYDLISEDYVYAPDRDAIETMKATGPLPYIVKNLALGGFEKNRLTRLSTEAYRAAYPSDLDALLRRCAISLSLEVLPELFIGGGGELNAFTFGVEERAFVVVDPSLVRLLTPRELTGVVGHELGHVKSGHMLYHTLGEVLSGGMSISASLLGLDILSIPIRLALLSWHRESEVTADRASLLVVDDIAVIRSLMAKLATLPRHPGLLPKDLNIEKNEAGILESFSEIFRTHPLFAKRFARVKEFAESEEYLRARRKIHRRQSLAKALIPLCRHCGEKKRMEDLFCPSCGRSQI